MSENNSRIKVLMLSVIALIVIAIVGYYFIEPKILLSTLPKPVVIDTTNQPTLGNPNARIHIVAFEDLKCSNCARFNVEIMPQIKKDFIDTNIAKYTVINLAFIPGSMPAANAAHCVYMQNNNLFFDYTDYIFHHQPPENQDWATVPFLMNIATHIKGIDANQLSQCLVKSPYDGFILNNLSIAQKVMNGQVATPTVYVNGILVTPFSKSQLIKIIKAVE